MPPRQGRICSPRRARVHHNPAERLRGGGRGVLRYRPERSQGEQHTKEKWTAAGRACVLPVPAQADFPSLWLNIPCSQADPLLPDNEHSVQGELLFRDFSSRRAVGRVGEKGKCGQGWIYRRESCGKRKCTAIPWAVFVDQIKPLPEPIPVYLCSIRGQSASMRKEEKTHPNLVAKLVNDSVPLVQPELLAGHRMSWSKHLTITPGALLGASPVRSLKSTQSCRQLK